MGSLNAEGLAEIRLQIQVKRYEKGSIGRGSSGSSRVR